MLPPWDFRSWKVAWLGSRQNLAKMSGGPNKIDYKGLIHLVSQNNPPWPISDYDMRLAGVVSLWYWAPRKDFLVHPLLKRTSIIVNNCSWTNKAWATFEYVARYFEGKVTYQKGVKHEFHAAHMDLLHYFYRQKHRPIFAATKCRHAAPRVCIRSLSVCFVSFVNPDVFAYAVRGLKTQRDPWSFGGRR